MLALWLYLDTEKRRCAKMCEVQEPILEQEKREKVMLFKTKGPLFGIANAILLTLYALIIFAVVRFITGR